MFKENGEGTKEVFIYHTTSKVQCLLIFTCTYAFLQIQASLA